MQTPHFMHDWIVWFAGPAQCRCCRMAPPGCPTAKTVSVTLSIRTKLFLTLLLAVTLVVVGMLGFMRWSFERGLVELAATRQEERIAAIAARLAERWRADGGWQRLRTDRRLWLATLKGWNPGSRPAPIEHLSRRRPPPWLRHALRDKDPGWPPHRVLRRLDERRLPPPLELRLMLLDAEDRPIYARPELLSGSRRYPIELNGTRIGSLALLPGASLSELGEIRFLERQTTAFLVIALAMIGLAMVLSLPLAKHLVRPLERLQAAVRSLAAGRFVTRVEVAGNDELGRLGRDLNTLAEALEQTEQARRQWVADISHELRTPLAVLRGELEALQDGVRPLDRAAVDSLYTDTRRLGRLVDDLYELSMTDLGALSYRKIETDPAQILATDLEAFAHEFAAAGLELCLDNRLQRRIRLQADGQRLSQLFRNLLRNSLRYTDPGGSLRIVLDAGPRILSLDFQDSAPGVPPEALPKLFDRLYRVEGSRSRDRGGSGLGLAICRNIVEAHGGRIAARPSPTGGVWIHIEIPL
jgi:two-component system sensor histidine kinase BaeS